MADSKPEDRLSFFYRDEVFTEKFLGGPFLIRNDYEKSKLHPPDKVIEDSEIIFRGPDPLPELGDAGRMLRMFGLILDRIVDDRELMLELWDFYKTDLDSIPDLCNHLGIKGLEREDWNVDRQRRYLRLMQTVHSEGAVLRSYLNLARLLGFLVTADTLVARRRWDSVYYNANIDSRLPAIDLDEMGSMDTWHESFPLALLRWRFYRRSTKSRTGVSSVPATKTLTDASAQFSQTAKVGNLIKIYNGSDVGDHVVVGVLYDTVLLFENNWGTGSESNLVYSNSWEVPYPDPWSDFLMTRFYDLAPSSMRVMHRDEPVINYDVP